MPTLHSFENYTNPLSKAGLLCICFCAVLSACDLSPSTVDTAPVPIQPPEGAAFGVLEGVIFEWQPLEEADGYELSIEQNNHIVKTFTIGSRSELQFDGALPAGEYTWRVRATNGGPWSDHRGFSLQITEHEIQWSFRAQGNQASGVTARETVSIPDSLNIPPSLITGIRIGSGSIRRIQPTNQALSDFANLLVLWYFDPGVDASAPLFVFNAPNASGIVFNIVPEVYPLMSSSGDVWFSVQFRSDVNTSDEYVIEGVVTYQIQVG